MHLYSLLLFVTTVHSRDQCLKGTVLLGYTKHARDRCLNGTMLLGNTKHGQEAKRIARIWHS